MMHNRPVWKCSPADPFNIFNHKNFHGADATFGGSNYGVISDACNPPVLQLAVRFRF